MKTLLKTICLLAVLAFLNPLKSQVLPFKTFSVESGLSQSMLLSIEQDNNGVIWLGTNNGGITTYDGSSYDYITIKDSLADNIVYCIEKDKKGNLWIGTNNGLSIFDGYTYKNYSVEDGLSHTRVYTVFFDDENTAYLGTGEGVSVFKNGKISKLEKDELLDKALVISIYKDTKEVLWFSTLSHGLFSLKNDRVRNFSETEGLASKYVYSVKEDANNKLHVFCHKGIYKMKNDSFQELLPNYFNDIVAYYGAEIDQFNNMWVASSRGVFKYDGNEFHHYTMGNGLVNNDIWKIFNDAENNLWFISKEKGASMLSSERFYKYSKPELDNGDVSSLYKTSDGALWIGTDRGLLSDNKGVLKLYSEQNGLPSEEVYSLLEDGKKLWVGTNYGIVYIEGGKIHPVENVDELEFMYCYKIFKDSKGDIWFGTKGGVAKLEGTKVLPFKKNIITSKVVFDIYEDKDGKFWFGTDEGLIMFDGSSVRHFNDKDGILKGRVRTLLSNEGNLWIGTSSGLYRYDYNKFERYAEKDGLSSDNIYSLVVDDLGNMWTGMSNGVNKLVFENGKLKEVKKYGPDEGFVSQVCCLNSLTKTEKGKLLFGTDNGLIVYQPKYDKANLNEANTRIISIDLFSQKTDWSLYADSVTRDNKPIDLELDYDKNYLAFHFIGVSHTNSSNIKYKYQLKGLDKGWLKSTFKTEAIYSNLPHGDYEFMVKSSNGDGIWNEFPTTFKFTIRPPFWLTWWFFTICAIIILVGIYSYLKIRAANIQILEKNEIIEEKSRNILDSINYAQKIQQAILPSSKRIAESFIDHFVLFMPKDIVSGDFYWMSETADKTLIASVDCTGHGVPGAFVSIVGNTGLNRAINEFKLSKPGEILDKLNELVVDTLNQDNSNEVKDGMDIALCSYDKKNGMLSYSGANNPLYVISKQSKLNMDGVLMDPSYHLKDYNLFEVKADKQPIGLFDHRTAFSTHTMQLEKGDAFYVFSDGYPDQFGGPKEKKFRYNRFRNLLLSFQASKMEDQKSQLYSTLNEWMGDLEQVDDICVVGVKV